jgi:hypothetical protein
MGRKDHTTATDKPASAQAVRDARLKAALKANMQRRKAQARARAAAADQDGAPEGGPQQS